MVDAEVPPGVARAAEGGKSSVIHRARDLRCGHVPVMVCILLSVVRFIHRFISELRFSQFLTLCGQSTWNMVFELSSRAF